MSDVIPALPAGVTITSEGVHDTNTGRTYAINASASSFLTLVDGKRTLPGICALLAERYQRPASEVLQDMGDLCRQLSRAHLLNLKMRWVDKLQWWLSCLISLGLPVVHPRRYDAPATSNYFHLLLWMSWLTCKVLCPIWLFVSALTVLCFNFRVDLSLPELASECLLFATIVCSIALHETSHLATLRWKLGKERGCVVCKGFLLKIVRPRLTDLKSEALVSLSGPAVPAVVAVLLASISLLSGGRCDWLTGMIFGQSTLYGSVLNWIIIAIFALHGLQLILPNPDLKNILSLARMSTFKEDKNA